MNTVRSFSLVFFSGGKKKTNMFGEELTHIHPLGLPHLTLQLSALVHRAQMWCPGLWSACIPAEGGMDPCRACKGDILEEGIPLLGYKQLSTHH